MWITLLTDFGHQDAYVGILKGVIAEINPQAKVIDLCHEITPQDCWMARFQLLTAFDYFPDNTIHLAIVDPGVGSDRRGIALQTSRGFLVGPDNGIFSGILVQHPARAAVALTEPTFWRTANPSATFHGRDIFAPVAAHLSLGLPLATLGVPIDPAMLVELSLPEPHWVEGSLQGVIQSIDRFGNLITNLTLPHLANGQSLEKWSLRMGTTIFPGCRTYSQVAQGKRLAMVGSHGFLEMAINQGHAARQLGVKIMDHVFLEMTTHPG